MAAAAVRLREVLPRDGFQDLPRFVPTATKVRIIEALHRAGLRWIEATSMVHPKWVPQFEDAEAVIARIRHLAGLRLAVFVPNRRGLDRARAAGVDEVSLAVASTDTLARSNFNASRDEVVAEVRRVAEAAMSDGLEVSVTIGGAFGCPFEGPVPEALVRSLVAAFAADGVPTLLLADTTGMGGPEVAGRLVAAVAAAHPGVALGCHFHGGAGALPCVQAALEAGARLFDTSLSGYGGCPFVPDAPGNVPTEAVVALFAARGVALPLDAEAIRLCAASVHALLEEETTHDVAGTV